MRISLYFISFLLLNSLIVFSQCGSTISTFPYNESFEAGTAGWTSGGLYDDWAWGTPSKTYINTAGAGTKCWMTGGTNGSFYNFGERSFVTSPCFNFTSITAPHVKMKIYWEGENQYDGTVFQYSLNNGATWTNVGSDTDPVDCLNQNWFNQSNINALTTLANPKPGWAGTILSTSGGCFGGLGSAGWVTAQHCMPYLAGQSNVQFRFAFGAGTICNAFDGFAFDDITIGEALSTISDFAFSCNTTQLGYQFTNTSSSCPSSYNWDFGDPLSGAANTSTSVNPTHVFSSPGSYNVTLLVNGPCGLSSSITKNVTTINSTISNTNTTCSNLSNGTLNAIALGGNGSCVYGLQPTATSNSTGSFTNLAATIYTVTITDATGCSITSSVTITSPNPITWTTTTANSITCNGAQNGQIHVTANGGTGAINYNLNPGNIISTTGNYTNLSIGTYTILASDANGCSTTTLLSITQPNALSISNFSSANILCFNGQDGQINISGTGGTGSLSYTLTLGSTNTSGIFTNLIAGNYTVVISDANNCSISTSTNLSQAPQLILSAINIIQPGCSPNNDGSINVVASGGTGVLNYSIGGSFGTSPMFNNMSTNTYTVTIKDANNCTTTSSITLLNANAPIFTSVEKSDILCFGQENGSINVVATSSNSTIANYSLSPGNKNSSTGLFNILTSNNYTITVTDVNGCTNTTIVSLLDPEKLVINNVTFVAEKCGHDFNGTIHVLSEGGTGVKTYTLTPTGNSNNTGIFTIQDVGNFTIQVKDVNNCSVYKSYYVPEIACCENIILPNAFSPNNDNLNDEFRIINTFGIDLNTFVIYNRWGQTAFVSQHIDDRWDGKIKGVEAPVGTYYYLVTYTCLSTGKKYALKGDLLLIR